MPVLDRLRLRAAVPGAGATAVAAVPGEAEAAAVAAVPGEPEAAAVAAVPVAAVPGEAGAAAVAAVPGWAVAMPGLAAARAATAGSEPGAGAVRGEPDQGLAGAALGPTSAASLAVPSQVRCQGTFVTGAQCSQALPWAWILAVLQQQNPAGSAILVLLQQPKPLKSQGSGPRSSVNPHRRSWPQMAQLATPILRWPQMAQLAGQLAGQLAVRQVAAQSDQ